MKRFTYILVAILMAWTVPMWAVADSTTTYQYDALGRVITVTSTNGSVTTYSYDAAGNRTQVVKTAGTPDPSSGQKVMVLPLLGGLVIPIS